MGDYLAYFISGPEQFVPLAAVGLVWLGLSVLGGALGGKERPSEADALVGWAVACVLFTLSGTLTAIPFTWIAGALGLAAAIAMASVWRRDGGVIPHHHLRLVALAAPLLILVSAMSASQWDEFSNWLPNVRFLLFADDFPNAANPETGSVFPAYPYGFPLLSYLASRLAGGTLLESAPALFNILLLLSFGVLAARLVRQAAGADDAWSPTLRWGWGWSALAGVLATLANPTFVQKIVLTAYADTASAVALGFAAILGWRMLEADAIGRFSEARRLSWLAGLSFLVLMNLKQSTPEVAALAIGGLVLAALRDPALGWRAILRRLPALVLPAALFFMSWRSYVALELPGQELGFRPFSEWAFGILPEVLGAMLLVASKKGFFFGLMTIAAVFGLKGLIRCRTPFDRLSVLVGAVFVGHNLFLLATYLGSFGSFDALRAASFWRYNMQLGMLTVAFGAFGAGLLWRRWLAPHLNAQRLAWLPIALLLAAPFTFAHKLRFDLEPPKPFFRTVAQALPNLLPGGSAVVVLDPRGTGESGVITRFDGAPHLRMPAYLGAFSTTDVSAIRRLVTWEKPRPYVLVHSVTPAVQAVLGPEIRKGMSYLLAPADGQWSILKTWPRPERP